MKVRNVNLVLLLGCFACLVQSVSRDDLKINNCEGYFIKFPDSKRIFVDKYCNDMASAFVLSGAGLPLVNGIYEKYGRMNSANKYELVLDNGTCYTLGKLTESSWGIVRGKEVLYMASSGLSSQEDPPEGRWRPAMDGVAPAPRLRVVYFPERKLKARRSNLSPESRGKCEVSIDEGDRQNCIQEDNLLHMLHPGVGPELGRFLHNRYKSAFPVESITLDGLLDPKALAKALTFLDVPLSSWIGPEEAFYCCEKKYRLNFTKWPKSNKRVLGVQQLLSSPTFIGFLEALTGIHGLVPMTAGDERMLWAGSSLIAIAPGGYLHVHNDFNYQSGLFRRINVLLYLNEDWKDEWQGHLELWDPNSTRCVQRILPLFNRMSIFTVLDDAFHGHPEPSTAPPGHNRYALQLVYYTSTPPPDRTTMFSGNKSTRTYPLVHGAIFQPPCVDSASLNMSFICSKDFAEQSNSGQPICECNFKLS